VDREFLTGAIFCTSCGSRVSAAANQPTSSANLHQPTSVPIPLQRVQSLVHNHRSSTPALHRQARSKNVLGVEQKSKPSPVPRKTVHNAELLFRFKRQLRSPAGSSCRRAKIWPSCSLGTRPVRSKDFTFLWRHESSRRR